VFISNLTCHSSVDFVLFLCSLCSNSYLHSSGSVYPAMLNMQKTYCKGSGCVSGTLRFGKIDVTEAQITIIFIHLMSAIFGPSVWMTKVSTQAGQL
jgi:hypothetical protein